MQFKDLSTGNSITWYWDLGNGTTSTSQYPSTTYPNSGNYTVTLTVAIASGTHTITKSAFITIYSAPTANIYGIHSMASCAPKNVLFTNLTTTNFPGTPTYFWDFGDGNTSFATNLCRIYNAQGAYAITLMASNSAGYSKSLTKPYYISPLLKPIAAFSAPAKQQGAILAIVNIANTSTNVQTNVWDFGDGTTSTAANPTHTYNVTGNYTVTLVAFNSTNCWDTMVQNAYVSVSDATVSFYFTNNNQCPGWRTQKPKIT